MGDLRYDLFSPTKAFNSHINTSSYRNFKPIPINSPTAMGGGMRTMVAKHIKYNTAFFPVGRGQGVGLALLLLY